MATDRYPNVSHFASINVADFARQNFMHAFHLFIPKDVKALLSKKSYPGLVRGASDLSSGENIFANKVLTCTIPYVESISVSRPASVQIIPTLGGGKHIEDRGRTREGISITGTSGHLPAVKPATDPFTPEFWQQEVKNISDRVTEIWEGNAKKLKELGKRSGYAWFHRLAQLFEIYWKIKRVEEPAIASKVQMVWINQKDDKYVVVVPMAFNYQRSAPKNAFTYDFSISLEVIEDFDATLKGKLKAQVSKANAPLVNKNWLQRANQTLIQASETLKAGRDFVNNIVTKAVNGFIRGPLKTLVNLQDIALTGLEAATGVQQNFIDNGVAIGGDVIRALNDTQSLLRQLDETVNLYQPNSGFQRAWNEFRVNMEQVTDSIKATAQGISSEGVYGQVFPSFDEYYNSTRPSFDIIGGFLSPGVNLTRTESLLGPVYNETKTAAGVGRNAITSGNPLYNTNILGPGLTSGAENRDDIRQTWTGVTNTRVFPGDTVFDIARRELNDINFWIDLVILNNLKPPYTVPLSKSKASGVLEASQEILIPGPFSTELDDFKLLISSSLGNAPQEFGQATSGDTVTLTDTTKDTPTQSWFKDQWKGFSCKILAGTNIGETRIIESNDSYNLYFYGTSTSSTSAFSPFPLPLDNTSEYQITLNDAGNLIKGVSPEQNFDRVLGFDLQIEKNSNEKFDLVYNAAKDAAVVEGLPSAAQSIYLMLLTPRGGNPFLPLDGLDARIGEKFVPEVVAEHRTFLRQAIISDPRVAGILRETLIVNDFSDIIGFEVTVEFIDGSTAPLGVTS